MVWQTKGEIMLTKTIIKNRILDKIASHKDIKAILEMGAGNESTFVIRKALSNNNKGYCLSLEAHHGYYESITSKMANGKHGRIEYSPLVYDGKMMRYSYKFSDKDKFDFIYIDGPGDTEVTDTRTGKVVDSKKIMRQFLSSKNIWVDPDCPKGGRSSTFLMDYILPTMNKDAIIIVDSRKMSVMYFYQKYHNVCDFDYVGGPISEKYFKRMVKKRYHEVVKFRPHLLTIITNKSSKKSKSILKELSLKSLIL